MHAAEVQALLASFFERGGTLKGSLILGAAGAGFQVKEGANARMGASALVSGSVVVANTSVTANTRILLLSQGDNGAPGFLRVISRVAGTSFTIGSSSPTDGATVAWLLIEPAP